jgi:RNA polymerase sigma-70 factor (ECF subfamily)
MIDTPVSLLERVKRRGKAEDWELLIQIYTPLIRRWLNRDQALQSDAEDLAQETLSTLVQKLPEFGRQRTGSFRRWLRIITVKLVEQYWRDRLRRERKITSLSQASPLLELVDPSSDLSRQWDLEHDLHVVQSLLAMIEPEFSRRTWTAFKQYYFEQKAPAVVAAKLGVSANVVFLAKSRVLKRLREIGRGLLD